MVFIGEEKNKEEFEVRLKPTNWGPNTEPRPGCPGSASAPPCKSGGEEEDGREERQNEEGSHATFCLARFISQTGGIPTAQKEERLMNIHSHKRPHLHRPNPRCQEDQQSQSPLAALLVEGDSLPI